MPIDMKLAGGWVRTAQPYVKLSPSAWTPLKRAFVKTTAGWKEIWPSEFVYVHTGYGYNMNMHACFGYPAAAGRYTFINRGYIGGSVNGGATDFALDTGIFPAGSELTFINEGVVSGSGGDGASFTSSSPPGKPRHATAGGNGFIVRFPTFVDNRAGIIQAGGGGGGAVGDFAGDGRHNEGGNGGAGLPGGRARIDTWGGNRAVAGTLTAGGASGLGGAGGAPGEQGRFPLKRVNDDYDMRTLGAGPGLAIKNAQNIKSGSLGIDATNVKGKRQAGPVSCQFAFFGTSKNTIDSNSRYGNWGTPLLVNLLVEGPGVTVTATRISGSSRIKVTKISNTQFSFANSLSEWTKWRSPQTFDSATFRFTASSAEGTDTFDMVVYCGRDIGVGRKSCFVAGSMITMADGSFKPIEEIQVGDVVMTAVGTSEVYDIDLPILGERALYEFADGKCRTSGEHSIWSRKPGESEEWWATRDMHQWIIEAESGDGPNFDMKPYDLTTMEGEEWEFATMEGWSRTTWKRVDAPESTQLYHLLLVEGGSYYVDGYLVSSMADSGGVDWHAYRHTGIKEPT